MIYPRENEFDPIITAAGARYGVPVPLLKSIFANESAFNPAAIGDQGRAYGIGQIWLATAKDMGFKGQPVDLLRPEIAIPLTAAYLAFQLKRYGGDVSAAMSAYNAGHNMIPKGDPTKISNATNREYLRRGLIHYNYFDGKTTAIVARSYLKLGQWLQITATAGVGIGVVLVLVGLGVFLMSESR